VRKTKGAANRLARVIGNSGTRYRAIHQHNDYAAWIRQGAARQLFEDILLSKSVLHREFIPDLDVQGLWSQHMQGTDRAEELCRILTFELWLQQVYARRYRQELPELAAPTPSGQT
jgi:hypothetical protein